MSSEVIKKTLTGFMREEIKRQVEDGQSGKKLKLDSQGNIIKEDTAVNHGYTEEYDEYNGQNEQNNDTGGLPARLPTEIMNEPDEQNNEYEQDEQPQDEYIANPTDETYENNQTYENNNENDNENDNGNDNGNDNVNTLEAEYAALDQEMAEQYYYINSDGYKTGPFSMDEITEKYKGNEISDTTQIWSGDQTKNDAKQLKDNEKIYSKLPRPPKRKQPIQKNEEQKNEEQKPLQIETKNDGRVEIEKTEAASNSKSCCVVL
eukprot:155500_1